MIGVLLANTEVHGSNSSAAHDHAAHDSKKIEISADSEWREKQNDQRIGRVHEQTRAQREKELRDQEEARFPYKDYLKFKHWLAQYGITAQLAPTVLNQWGAPMGGKPAFQGT